MTTILPAPGIGFTVTRAFATHVTHFGRTTVTLHEIEPGAARTSCYTAAIRPYAHERDGIVNPANLVGQRVRWCDRRCWVGHRRCVICGGPSGDFCECGPCIRRSIDVDTAFQRAS